MDLSREITLIRQLGEETEYKEDITAMYDHGMIVGMLTEAMAKALMLPEEEINDLVKASMLHDIGKLKLSAYLYGRRDDFLDIDELRRARTHPVLSRDIVSEAGIYNENIVKYVYLHHENQDGSGYPERIKGEETPLGARILHVADTFVSLVSERPFRRAYDIDTALSIMSLEPHNYDLRLLFLLMEIVYDDGFAKINTFIKQANERYISLNGNS